MLEHAHRVGELERIFHAMFLVLVGERKQPPRLRPEDKVEASFNNGVLKVSLPKRPEAIGKQRTIPIKKG